MNLENLKLSMKRTVFKNFHFNEQMKNGVKDKVRSSEPFLKKKPFLGPLLSAAFVAIFFIGTTNFVISNLTGSNNGSPTNTVLDTSLLKIIEQEEQLTGMPDEYNAPSVEIALQAIPFKVKLPQELPFENNPFTVDYIQDLNGDGEVIKIAFQATSKNPKEFQILSLQVTNRKSELHNGEEIIINDNIAGSFGDSQLIFEHSGVYYLLDYITDKPVSPEQMKEILIETARQMI
ncbi:hypothetical protein WAK64_14690 [Bacillus spongiae]|uniref:DUF4367 domain-containing protein n=1 Tax=Bacillus spongiae TaxID=2683610 RepID=A0ABU8HGA1_9BACI